MNLLDSFVFVTPMLHHLARSVCALLRTSITDVRYKQDNKLGLAKSSNILG